MFFSERDLFSIDLYVADAKTGEVIRKVTDTATDAHTESLQFIGSAGSWDRPASASSSLASTEDNRCSQFWTSIAARRSARSASRRRRDPESRPGRLTANRSRSRAWSAASTTCSSSISTRASPGGSPRTRSPSSIPRGRPTAAVCVQHRSLHHEPASARGRPSASGHHGRRVGRGARGGRLRGRQEHQPAVGG